MTASSRTALTPPSFRAARERRTVLIGVAVVTVALVFTYVLLPFAQRWQTREVEIAQTRAQIQELAALVLHAGALDSAASRAEQRLVLGGRRTFRARSATLAASALQSYLQDAADASRLVVTRLDVASANTLDGGAPIGTAGGEDGARSRGREIPATLSAYCDITGLADVLAQFAHGPRVVLVDRVTVQQTSALRGAPDMLQVTLTLRAPVSLE